MGREMKRLKTLKKEQKELLKKIFETGSHGWVHSHPHLLPI